MSLSVIYIIAIFDRKELFRNKVNKIAAVFFAAGEASKRSNAWLPCKF